MPTSTQIPLLEMEEKPAATKNNAKSKAGAGGLVGLGLIALCGLCCSLPLLAGGGLALSGAAILACLTSLWPLALVAPVILFGAIIMLRLNRRRAVVANGATATQACNSCQLDGSCGCKN